jgi:Arc/MetJ-type ribon-helix-helix transcriptional regulator
MKQTQKLGESIGYSFNDIHLRRNKQNIEIRQIRLTADLQDLLQQLLEDGRYQNAVEAIRDALCMLQQKLRPNGGPLRGAIATQRSLRRPCTRVPGENQTKRTSSH